MKKKRTIISVVVAIAVVAIGAFFALKPSPASINQIDTQINATGKKCSYTVGCSCSGFKPKTNGDVWEEAYCKNCGHHKKFHKN